MQMNTEERDIQQKNLFNDIASIIQEKCVHPDSQRQFSLYSIQAALKKIQLKVILDRSAKKQVLLCFLIVIV